MNFLVFFFDATGDSGENYSIVPYVTFLRKGVMNKFLHMLSSSITPFLQLITFAKGSIIFLSVTNKIFFMHGTVGKVLVTFETNS